MAKDQEESKDPDKEEDIYNEEEREKQTEDAEISPREEGFVKGYEDDEEESEHKKDTKESDDSEDSE